MKHEETVTLHARRESYLRSLAADPNFQEFIQEAVFDNMEEELGLAVKNPSVTGPDLELARNKWLWAIELKNLIKSEIKIYDRVREQEKERIKDQKKQRE